MIQGGDPTGARPPALTYGGRTTRELNVHTVPVGMLRPAVWTACTAAPSPNPSKGRRRGDSQGPIVQPGYHRNCALRLPRPTPPPTSTTSWGTRTRAEPSREVGWARRLSVVAASRRQHQAATLHFTLSVCCTAFAAVSCPEGRKRSQARGRAGRASGGPSSRTS